MPDTPEDAYPYERAWRYALWLLGRQAYTGAQLQERLRRKGATPETVERVLAKLVDLEFVDDALYAEAYVRSRSRNKGALRLRQELFHKGVNEELVEKALGALDERAQVEAASALVEKNLWRWKGEPRERYAKAYAFLVRRGFPADVVRAALEHLPPTQDI
ncbi:regulatory protein RecX [Truepera radiovictrix]|uniref:Regulatory protein RecX n=1 Tax=Truepera radiovictrix (strain DSM 17093 / CIP 108686 / LMG 22925 / RQ-24) TaxID=649638 RepID=D7CQQ9_TRURR|nr:regulatory protein RecX [Truepera radiovictrix]ADI15043.1 regulatory protein RecX [Truepera radiovictrix DSM 17093]WMT56404.1 regulatory protein RecX [Truepera radiovictrix]